MDEDGTRREGEKREGSGWHPFRGRPAVRWGTRTRRGRWERRGGGGRTRRTSRSSLTLCPMVSLVVSSPPFLSSSFSPLKPEEASLPPSSSPRTWQARGGDHNIWTKEAQKQEEANGLVLLFHIVAKAFCCLTARNIQRIEAVNTFSF